MFVLNAPNESGVGTSNSDLITDFEGDGLATGDVINLLALDANTGAANDQAFSFIGHGAQEPDWKLGVAGAERPASEVSTIKCGFSLGIVAIDENKSLSGDSTACSYSLLPGRHVFRVSIAKKEFGLYPGTYRQQGDQVVEYDLVAGKTYSLHASEDEKSPGLWRINMIDPVVNRFVTLKEVRLVGAKAGG